MNTDLQAKGTPADGELAILDPLRKQLDPSVSARCRSNRIRTRLARCVPIFKARELLTQVGWTYQDGALRNAKGQPFVFEILDDTGGGASMEPVAAAFGRNLQKLGITMNFCTVDYALIQKRLDAFDYEMASMRMPDVQIPGTEQVSRFGSKYADQQGSDNLAGVKSPAIDAILQKVVNARTREQLVDATHALDRVLMNGYGVIPHWYSAPHRIAYRNTMGYPSTLPLYYAAEEWVLSAWWKKK